MFFLCHSSDFVRPTSRSKKAVYFLLAAHTFVLSPGTAHTLQWPPLPPPPPPPRRPSSLSGSGLRFTFFFPQRHVSYSFFFFFLLQLRRHCRGTRPGRRTPCGQGLRNHRHRHENSTHLRIIITFMTAKFGFPLVFSCSTFGMPSRLAAPSSTPSTRPSRLRCRTTTCSSTARCSRARRSCRWRPTRS